MNDEEAANAPRPPRDPSEPTTLDLAVGGFARAQLVVLCVNALVAAFFSVVEPKPFLLCLVYTQAIGNSIFWINWALHRIRGLPTMRWRTTAVALVLGGLVGFLAARGFEIRGMGRPFLEPGVLGPPLAGALVFGSVLAYAFHARAAVAQGRARLREEKLHRLERQQQLTEAELKLLQAQIEPHFLFNTLSNVLQLIDADPRAAKRMLVNLTSYLRASLHRTRAGATTLGEELDLVRAYLQIQAERMGARLSYCIDCPAELRGLPLPPLLVQPLVENAVRHGLEARPGGGEVRIRAEREAEILLLDVDDTGVGMDPNRRAGVGLANVRARVSAVSQGRGNMVLRPGAPHGLCVRLALPLDALDGASSSIRSGSGGGAP